MQKWGLWAPNDSQTDQNGSGRPIWALGRTSGALGRLQCRPECSPNVPRRFPEGSPKVTPRFPEGAAAGPDYGDEAAAYGDGTQGEPDEGV